MRWPAIALALAIGLTTSAVAFGGETDDEYRPSGWNDDGQCRAHTEGAGETHTVIFKIRCPFEITNVRVEPNARIGSFDRRPSVTRRADPGDRFRCTKAARMRLRCRGKAGRGARITGRFTTVNFSCDTDTRFGIFGGVDCDPPATACIAIGLGAALRDRRPSPCFG